MQSSNTVIEAIERTGLIPVAIILNAETAVTYANVLMEHGIPLIEVTYRSDAALEAMRLIKLNCPGMLVGAGTVVNCKQIDDAINAGVDFIVTPGLNETTARYCQEKGITHFPGVGTATEIETAMALGYKYIKFYPVKTLGGPEAVESFGATYSQMRFITTGGVELNNLKEYCECPYILAPGGDFLGTHTEIAAGAWDTIGAKCDLANEIALGAEPVCMVAGAAANPVESWLAERFSAIPAANNNTYGAQLLQRYSPDIFQARKPDTSVYETFAGLFCRTLGLERCMVYAVNSVNQAMSYFKHHGISVDSEKQLLSGKLRGFVLKDSVGDIRIAFIQKRVVD